ncbi:hypothetical protein K0U27_08735 [archaeon]|nr:hypothetical protein [archaeon]
MAPIFVKAGVITGIVFTGFVMVLLDVSIIPNILDQPKHTMSKMSDDELNGIFLESKEYVACANRFPDHEMGLFRDQNNAIFQAGSTNPETGKGWFWS